MINIRIFSQAQLSSILSTAAVCDRTLNIVSERTAPLAIKGWAAGVAGAMHRMLAKLDDEWTVVAQAKSSSLKSWSGAILLDDGKHTTALPVALRANQAVVGDRTICVVGKHGRLRVVEAIADWVAKQALPA